MKQKLNSLRNILSKKKAILFISLFIFSIFLFLPSKILAVPTVYIYQHTGYGGASVLFTADHPNFNAISGPSSQGTWNDVASSIKVPAGLKVTLFEHTGYGGKSLLLTADHPNFNAISGPSAEGTWNDVASSIKIEAISTCPSSVCGGFRGGYSDFPNWRFYGLKPAGQTGGYGFPGDGGTCWYASTQSCSYGCQNGQCQAAPTCTNECSPSGKKECTDSTHYRTCGNYDSDSCLDWDPTPDACPSGQTCSGGVCSIAPTDTTPSTSSIISPAAGSWQNANFSVSVTDSDTGGSGLAACYFHVLDLGLGQWTAAWQNRTCNSSFSVTVGSTGYCKSQGSNICEVWAFAKDGAGNIGASGKRKFSIGAPTNRAPNTPSQPSGPTLGNINTSYTYSTSTTDPDSGDTIKYGWDWDGNGTVDEWSGLKASGATDSRPHSWAGEGTFNVKVKACDNKNACSGWSPSLAVTIKVPKLPVPCNCEPPSNDGLYKICYYGGTGLNPLNCVRETTDSGPNLYYTNWGNGEIAATGRSDNISASLRGFFNFDSGRYKIKGWADDGFRLKINDQIIYDNFADDGTKYTGSLDDKNIFVDLSGRSKVEIFWNEKRGMAWLEVYFEKQAPIEPPFGCPMSCPINISSGYAQYSHGALDLTCATGTTNTQPLYAISHGDVLFAGYDSLCGYQVKMKTVGSDGNTYGIRYCHMYGPPYLAVSTGDTVEPGKLVGYLDNSGGSTTVSHLHLCVEKNGTGDCLQAGSTNIDPRTVIPCLPQ